MSRSNENRLQAWAVDEHAFARTATAIEKLSFCLQYAILAPSTHNTQPWRFVISDDMLLLCADRTRALPVSDTYDRELTISCGAALFNLRVALSHFGCPYLIRVMPAVAEPDVLASLQISDEGFVDADIATLFPSMAKRVTNRRIFDAAPVPQSAIALLREAAEGEGAQFAAIADEAERSHVADLIDQADRVQLGDPRFRRELASWVSATRRDDGMASYSASAGGLLDFASPVISSVVRTFDIGGGVAASHRRLVEGSPLLICLATATDDAESWLLVGQAMQRVLLTLTANGLHASFLNQPIEVESLRCAVGAMTGTGDFPQLLLRVGHGPEQPHTPRRPVESVTT
ncbi:Acg family FMN-binding oxidoreductase [Pandoraea communis]|uniref:Acg family FMN-binding oxidoreductase n=1 Tax=Pandoraea communis TaxID=2508297 RepID=UPI0025A66FA2|nr:nitroreductase family protein [Pandoraea communis]MDM8358028.1 nitroreductase family protein [Pandoraea communis]